YRMARSVIPIRSAALRWLIPACSRSPRRYAGSGLWRELSGFMADKFVSHLYCLLIFVSYAQGQQGSAVFQCGADCLYIFSAGFFDEIDDVLCGFHGVAP